MRQPQDTLRQLVRQKMRQQSLKDLASRVLERQPLTLEAERSRAITAARDAVDLDHYRLALSLGRLHLCGNCSRFTFGTDPGGEGTCSEFGSGLVPFAMPFWCAGFRASKDPAAPAFLPVQDNIGSAGDLK